jgi:hypothetical protein
MATTHRPPCQTVPPTPTATSEPIFALCERVHHNTRYHCPLISSSSSSGSSSPGRHTHPVAPSTPCRPHAHQHLKPAQPLPSLRRGSLLRPATPPHLPLLLLLLLRPRQPQRARPRPARDHQRRRTASTPQQQNQILLPSQTRLKQTRGLIPLSELSHSNPSLLAHHDDGSRMRHQDATRSRVQTRQCNDVGGGAARLALVLPKQPDLSLS